jgi:hypothetical protein
LSNLRMEQSMPFSEVPVSLCGRSQNERCIRKCLSAIEFSNRSSCKFGVK